jgi:hypothetical protein
MKTKLKTLFVGLFALAIVVVASSKAFAFGENGCRWNPENPVGICYKNTEGTWDCYEISSNYTQNCTSSD